jgi:uncharacterized protein (DUF302 family)
MLRTVRKMIIAGAAAACVQAAPAFAAGDDVFTVTTDVPFEDAAQAVNDAIINKGYAVDYHGYVGDMLKRTAEDVGAEKQLYKDAEFFTFCSAVLSRKAMEADIGDIAYCPYVVFVYEDAATPGKVTIGHRKLPKGDARDEVNAVLDDIVKTASDGF